MTEKIVHVIGGSTSFPIDAHLSLYATGLHGQIAEGGTARRITALARELDPERTVHLHLTKTGDKKSTIVTNEDLKRLVLEIVDDPQPAIVFFNPAVVDFSLGVEGGTGLDSGRIRTRDHEGAEVGVVPATLVPEEKLILLFRQGSEGRKLRKDIFLVGFKATAGAPADEQYRQGLDLLKRVSANLVLANDTVTGLHMIVVPEEGAYHVSTDRHEVLRNLVEMAYLRSKLRFTRSTVVPGDIVPWHSALVPDSLRKVVDHCVTAGAYKPVRGATAGHFAVKVDDSTFLTSRRKTNFNDLSTVGLVRVTTHGQDSVIAHGSKPSVGGQSQRIVFQEHPDADCIVHFHAVPKEGCIIPTVSQREYECGSHECGENTSRGLGKFGDIYAVNLKDHGFNIVFPRSTDPDRVIDFIDTHCDLAVKSGGYQVA